MDINQIRSNLFCHANHWKITSNFDDWNAVRRCPLLSLSDNPFTGKPTILSWCYFLGPVWYVDDKIIAANLSMVNFTLLSTKKNCSANGRQFIKLSPYGAISRSVTYFDRFYSRNWDGTLFLLCLLSPMCNSISTQTTSCVT